MALDVGVYSGMPGVCFEKILAATNPDSEDASSLDWILDDTGLTAEEVHMKLSTWKKTTWQGEVWYYDPECSIGCFDYNDWGDGIMLFGADFDLECTFDLVQIGTSTQDTDGF